MTEKTDEQMEITLHSILKTLDGLTVRQVNLLLANVQNALLEVGIVNQQKVADVSFDPSLRLGRGG